MRGWHHIDNGWLLPDGRFVPCRARGHLELVVELADPFGREPPGWIKLASGAWITSSIRDLSQAQIDFVWDWSQARGRALPAWLRALLAYGEAPERGFDDKGGS